MSEKPDQSELSAAIDLARQDPALGRSVHVRRLFEYLSVTSLEGRSPKETEVAIEVFSRDPGFDPTRDAIARVYVHKLRQRLDAIYDTAGVGLEIPRGEYRLTLRDDDRQSPPQPYRRRGAMTAALAILLVLTAGYLIWTVRGDSEQARAARSPLWAELLDNGRPTVIAMGDYYIFGDMGTDGETRLVREYSVNSATDLNRFQQDNPARAVGYYDLDLRYLPVGGADVLVRIGGIFEDGPPARVVPASRLTPAMIRDNNIVYVGYLSGLGALMDPAFAGSRYTIGATFDDLIDSRTDRRFESGGGAPDRDKAIYEDYGYLSTFAGPTGNRFIIIAGTRDAGLSQMGNAVINRAILDQLAEKSGPDLAGEALFGVSGLEEVNMESRMIGANPLNQAIIWKRDGDTRKVFPAG